LRGKWGLNDILDGHNRKNRNDHRHHAVDAIVIGCTSRSLLNEVSKKAGAAEENNLDRLFGDFPEPMPNFRDQVRATVQGIIVSHKPEHAKGGALHEASAYGLNVKEHERHIGNVVYRKPLDSITVKEVERVRDPKLRKTLVALRDDGNQDQKKFSEAVRKWSLDQAEAWRAANPDKPHRNPIRRVRLLKPEGAIVPIHDRKTGQAYKGVVPAENWCVDIVKMRDGTWKGCEANIFEVNKKGWRPRWEREKWGALLVMRLHKGDLIELEDPDGIRRVKRVVRIQPSSSTFRLAGHNEAGALQERHDATEQDDGFRWDFANFGKLRDRKARKVRLDELGQILPG
jgi:CRISPR-associated endonuclease Csn1